MLKNTPSNYGIISKIFHSCIGASILYMLYLGYTMTGLEASNEKWALYGQHKSIGTLILIAALLFYIWRLFNMKPDEGDYTFIGQRFLSNFVKYSLLLIMAIYPISGYVMSVAGGHTVKVFDWFTLPMLFEKNEEIGNIASMTHGYLLYITLILVALHFIGVVYHSLVTRDGTLGKMTYTFKNKD